jgi:uncharacterized protein (DUF934 family)
MPLLKDGQAVEDNWTTLDDDTPLAAECDLIVSLEQWQAGRDRLRGRNGRLGLRLASDQPPAAIAEDLEHFALIALEFPRFGDGRAYSYARLLRERYGFTGELRAVGNVLRDQLLFMLRCGFDAFEIADESAVEAWQAAIGEFTVWYQPAGDSRQPASVLRRTAVGKAG